MNRGRKAHHKKGFSLIEILVVLALLMLVMGISIPAVSNISRSRAGSELGKFNAFLKKMFMKAVRKDNYIRIVVDMKNGTYWAEKSEGGFFVMSGQESAEFLEQRNRLLEDLDNQNETDRFAGKGGAASVKSNILDTLRAKNDLEDEGDFYNWENFVPDKRSIKDLIKPAFEQISDKMALPQSLSWSRFFSYHTPQIITNDADLPDMPEDGKEKTYITTIHIFPQGRIEPFYLAIGDKEGRIFNHIHSDFFLNTRIEGGDFNDDVVQMHEKLFIEGEEEGL